MVLPFWKSIGCEFSILTQLTENIQKEFSNEKHLGVLTGLGWNEVLRDQHLEAEVKVEIGLPEDLCIWNLNFQGRWPASVRAYLLTHQAWNLSKSGNFLTFHCNFCMWDFLHKTFFARVPEILCWCYNVFRTTNLFLPRYSLLNSMHNLFLTKAYLLILILKLSIQVIEFFSLFISFHNNLVQFSEKKKKVD